jgi:acetyltransferase-like isoleucine patch superfamily enzyme
VRLPRRIPSIEELRRRIGEERRQRRTAYDTARVLMPPPPSAFGAYGHNTWIAPPGRVSLPSSVFLGDDITILERSFLSVVAAVPGVTPKLTIGDRTSIGAQSHIACVGEIDIGPEVLTAARIFIGDTYHRYEDPDLAVIDQPMAEPEKVTIGRGSFLGIGSAVLMGVTVGEHAYIGAGAVVTTDVEPHTLVVGNPARPVRRWDPRAGEWTRL